MPTILICGDRNWDDREMMEYTLEMFEGIPNLTFVHGDARGADKMAGDILTKMGHKVVAYPADWDKYGKKAGPIRNRTMFEQAKPDLAIAFHKEIWNSKGTKHMVNLLKEKGVPVTIFGC